MTRISDMLVNPRYDVMLVWGHGYSHLHGILEVIRNEDLFAIVHVETKTFSNIKNFVKRVYSFDYAPLQHLKDKIRYLTNTEPKVTLILLKNKRPDEDFSGNGLFRHVESKTLVQLKKKIREAYNPRNKDGMLNHDHVVHTTDSETQTNHLLRLFGYRGGISKFCEEPSIVNLPHYLNKAKSYSLLKVDFQNIRCVNLIGEALNAEHKIITIEESVQFLGLSDIKVYEKYVSKHLGYGLKKYYTTSIYMNMAEEFVYLYGKYSTNYIICKRVNHGRHFLIVDGLHRAAIHRFQGNNEILLMVSE